jgi:hypothetical protein
MSRYTEEVFAIVQRVRPLLAGKPPQIQGAVLADLTATFIGGYGVVGNAEATDVLRDELLKMHVDTVKRLIPVNAPSVTFAPPEGNA